MVLPRVIHLQLQQVVQLLINVQSVTKILNLEFGKGDNMQAEIIGVDGQMKKILSPDLLSAQDVMGMV